MRIQELLTEGREENATLLEMFKDFLPLAMSVLDLNSLPKMKFEKYIGDDDQPTFGQYHNGVHILYIALANRHPNDILRTVAHELVHYKQDLDQRLNNQSGETGSSEENEANALAGVIMRHFNKRYPQYLRSRPL